MINIGVDGPSGAGKSTLARLAAREFGIMYVDTGAIYRTVALAALRGSFTDLGKFLETLEIGIEYDADGRQRMLLDGEDVSGLIRGDDVSREASRLAALPEVRDFLMETQRELAQKHDVIMDGRDIGTVVLPDAGLKIYLTADTEERAMRRYRELLENGADTDYAEVLKNLKERDENDINREHSPLKAAEDAVVIDTTYMTFEESAQALFDAVRVRYKL